MYLGFMSEVTITVRTNGPYKVEGPVRIVDAEGRELAVPEERGIVLCRCGHSQTKPFCDKSHRQVCFVADDVAPRVEA
jgi:CDGSH-type Zn-finger protein